MEAEWRIDSHKNIPAATGALLQTINWTKKEWHATLSFFRHDQVVWGWEYTFKHPSSIQNKTKIDVLTNAYNLNSFSKVGQCF
jgi:hypothetical protein